MAAFSMNEAERLLSPTFQRSFPPTSDYHQRLREEFELIQHNDFTRVFLQVQIIIGLCKKLSIPHIIRGSAGSSLVCYLMGISHTDPLKYEMDLARFMNHGRIDLPDIDIDVPYNRRDELYAAIGSTWSGAVARISNHVLYQYRSALQEALRLSAPGVTYKRGESLEKLVKDPEKVARVRATMDDLMGTLRTESLHCGGIVIFDREGAVPADLILKEDDDALPQIRLNKDETEEAGYIKIDILSNRGLAQQWEASGGKHVTSYPARDDAVARIFSTGNTIGITFGESRGMRHIFKQLMPTTVLDVSVALALIRPAAAAGGRKSAYLAALRAGCDIPPDIERPIIYDDDALARIRAAIAAPPIPKQTADSMADYFRKAFAKQRIGDIMRFRDLCRSCKHSEDTIRRLMDDLNNLQHYSFCKSHALSYAQLVWALAYEKAHNPHAFWVAALNHCNSDYRTWVHWREARSAGLKLTRGVPPYRLGAARDGAPAVLPARGEQHLLISDAAPSQIYSDMKLRGYWCAAEFYPGCYRHVRVAPQRKLKRTIPTLLETQEYIVEFCGLVATGRVVRCETDGEESASTGGGDRCVTFLCIGYDNGKFLDLVVHGAHGHLLGWAALVGTARTKYPDADAALEVVSVKGIGLKVLALSNVP